MKSFIIPAHFVPEQVVTSCYECPYFEHRGGSYGEYHRCQHPHGPDDDLYFYGSEDIADNCPELKEMK